MPAFFISSTEIRGTELTLTGELCHHLRASLRVKPGEVLRFTDEHRQRYQARVSTVAPEALTADILESRPGPIDRAPRVILAQVILKGDHMDWVVQKTSELGVTAVFPLTSRHGVVRPQPERVATQVARWQRIATEAAQQSEQWQAPQVSEPLEVRRFFSGLASTTALLLAERQDAVGLANILLPALPTDTITVIVGPEGGWAEEELSQAREGQCQAVSLGEHILRADTASVAALSIVQSRLGRLG
ncbi:MAG: RsmE family RNA methyltransferase [Nitrospira sp.]